MSIRVTKSIAIIGGGASATLLLAQLTQQLSDARKNPVDIYIIDNSQTPKVGLAYSVSHPSFLLNVAASRMGAYVDKPKDFYDWLVQHQHCWRNLHPSFADLKFDENSFMPRMVYGAYLRWIFNEAEDLAATKNINIKCIRDWAINVTPAVGKTKLDIHLKSGKLLSSDSLIIATGNACQNHVSITGDKIYSSPYERDFIMQDWFTIKHLTVLGSGLSMVDALEYVTQQGFKGATTVISRNALMPLAHATQSHNQNEINFPIDSVNSIMKLVKHIRREISENVKNGNTWQSVIDAFRLRANKLWFSLSDKEKYKFRHIKPWWTIARHRIPDASYEKIKRLQRDGELRFIKLDISCFEKTGLGFLLQSKNDKIELESDSLVICCGYNYKFENLRDLLGLILDSKAVIQDRLIENDFKISSFGSVYALGPCLGDLLFETTSIHDIRQQAFHLSKAIAADCN